MEIWVDADRYDVPPSEDYEFRIWQGSDPEVAEVALDDFRGQEEALSLVGMVPWIMVRCSDWKMIPLENLVAASSGSGTRIAVAISQELDMQGAAFALEHGVDAVVLPPEEQAAGLWSSARAISGEKGPREENREPPVFSTATVVSVSPGGVGERVCVDLVERLSDGEGMAIGSSSSCLCVVHGETIPSQYVPSRPFRINAGAVHSYALMGDGSTKYLSEINSGDQVSVLSHDGSIRAATVGRLKIERRPFLKVSFESENGGGQIMAQQAETVRIISESGEAISITDMGPGNKIVVLNEKSMRHIGKPVQGEVREK